MSRRDLRERLLVMYGNLYCAFGPQLWWPGDIALEIMIGAVLTQNTAWGNVEKAIENLKRNRLFPCVACRDCPSGALLHSSGRADNTMSRPIVSRIPFFFSVSRVRGILLA
jgi:hypothetical protein